MSIFDKARQLERHLARGMSGAARNIMGSGTAREPIEIVHAIVDEVEREIQPGGRGTRVFPFNTIDLVIAAPSSRARARLETMVSGDPPLRDRIVERLRAARCTLSKGAGAPPPAGSNGGGIDLDVNVTYAAKPQKHWTDPHFGVAFSRVTREPAPPPSPAEPAAVRLEMTVVNGAAEHRTYGFACDRIDLGRGSEVRDTRNGLVRTNHVAFTESPAAAANRSVSRQHSHIEYDPRSRTFRLHDDGSLHGTRIVRKGKTLPVPFGARGVRLQPGDDIVLGDARVRVRF
jgi:hypothetical protein